MKINEIHFETIGSTNTYARENASSLLLPALITAKEQTGGRGRRGRSFYSPKDTGIYFTLLFRPCAGFDLITPSAAVCVCESIEESAGIKTDIKWVNDIFYGGRKIAGILCERFVSSGTELVAAGIGINLTTEIFPDDIPFAGSLGADIDGVSLARNISAKMLKLNENFNRAEIIGKYKSRLFILGKKVTYIKNGTAFEGVAEDINEECNLKVKTESGTDILSSGEISVTLTQEAKV